MCTLDLPPGCNVRYASHVWFMKLWVCMGRGSGTLFGALRRLLTVWTALV